MAEYPKITIVTPVLNDVQFIESSILSILQQDYPNLEYMIIDGGSTDGTIDIIRKYQNRLSYWISEKDQGMYDAIQKGFIRSSGEIMGWLNSDDIHHRRSLFTIGEIFREGNNISWIQGTPNIVDEQERIVYASPRPEVDKFFFYQLNHIKTGKYIQQESTFWRRKLWEKAGGYVSTKYSYAGDFELWLRFFKSQQLYLIPALLGAFRLSRREQSSKKYLQQYIDGTLQALKDHPLGDVELESLNKIKFLDRFENRILSLRWLKSKIQRNSMTVIPDKVFFDGESQSFKVR